MYFYVLRQTYPKDSFLIFIKKKEIAFMFKLENKASPKLQFNLFYIMKI